ncbi:MAG: Glyoxalase/bleomycin resistance protein/dioxygenase [Candidatus Gottesmanbacteria bacterium GW2011_GWC2_39_8]|uniref:Glyoxalase/bleomycin resistance protein/dioxygenase n=1 Tax=Candidatus Gottesmanbacteria bacterium GW2011_GWC2_39_8 TaxID=1618450 RepID=A0A0G0PU96_9BACT|nr:MAG: Glyoxalase/bleomycin resistance protein/dioxygenase [Candidatus Gottesmanbacteria bacterium GW2011_GWC2_39_8]
MKMNPVVHFEMPVEDRQRLVEFYTKVFGWKMEEMGEDMEHYVVATTTKSDEKSRMKNKEQPDHCPSVVIAVDDVEDAMKKIKNAGGEMLGEPMDIPTVGLYVSFRDTEGNRVSILQPMKIFSLV